jgi:hypothetical protein
MGISNVAIKTFNSSGSQSVCRANKFKEDTLIESDFLTKCTTSYISGTGQSVIQGSIKGFPTGLPAQASNHDIFDIPDDVDAISDIVLTGTINFDIPENPSSEITSYVNSTSVYFSDYLFLSMIDKIEVKLGGLIIDTITSDSIYARNVTELDGEVCKYSGSKRMCESPNVYTNRRLPRDETLTHPVTSENLATPVPIGTSNIKNNKVEWSISIPFTGRGSQMTNAFLQAGSTTNTLSMKVYYNHFDPLRFHSIRKEICDASTNTKLTTENSTGCGIAAWPLFGYHQATYGVNQEATNWKFSTSATITTHMITETEKNFIRNNIVNRVLKTSETLEFPEPEKLLNSSPAGSNDANDSAIISTKPPGDYTEVLFDISNFECNCSHIILSLRLPSFNDNSLTKHIDTAALAAALSSSGFLNNHLQYRQKWPSSAGLNFDMGKNSTLASVTGSGPWPRSPMDDGFWSGVDHLESYSPLIPDDNRGDFNSCETITHYPLIPFNITNNNAGSMDSQPPTNSTDPWSGVNPILKKPHYPEVPKVGYVQDWLHSVELVVGGERTGFIPGTALQISQLSDYGLKNHNNEGVYILKLSDSAFSTSGIPLAKCNSVKLNIRINNDIYNPVKRGVGTSTEDLLTSTNYDFTGDNLDGTSIAAGKPKLVATAVGTTVQTTVGGSISLSA